MSFASFPAYSVPVTAATPWTNPDSAPSVLITDDEPSIRSFYRITLEALGLRCMEACNGQEALELYEAHAHDLVILDVDMPQLNGIEACMRLRHTLARSHVKIILISGRLDPDNLATMLLNGADDFLTKPLTWHQLQARVQSLLRLKQAQERSDHLHRRMVDINRDLEEHLKDKDGDLIEARNALVLALAKLCECRHQETGEHLQRLQFFCRRLARQAKGRLEFEDVLTDNFIDMLATCVPLHDIGKVGLPDHVLLKPGKLSNEERLLMQSHTLLGAETLKSVAREHRFALPYLEMSIDITRHHHERYDGTGYPDRLRGDSIPLTARFVSICDVYDALRSRRVYKPAMPHPAVVSMMADEGGKQFDPALLQCFIECADDFEKIYDDWKDC